jgi:hypothetical protein
MAGNEKNKETLYGGAIMTGLDALQAVQFSATKRQTRRRRLPRAGTLTFQEQGDYEQ